MGCVYRKPVLSTGEFASVVYCMSQREICGREECKMQDEDYGEATHNEEAFFYHTIKDFELIVSLYGAKKVAEEMSKLTGAAVLDALSRRFYDV